MSWCLQAGTEAWTRGLEQDCSRVPCRACRQGLRLRFHRDVSHLQPAA